MASPSSPLSLPVLPVSSRRRGTLFIVSGPSGVGKGTIVRELLARESGIALSVSVTTRSPRPGEQEGTSYFFKSVAEFQRMVQEGELLEHAQFGRHFYGTPRAFVESRLREGQDVILEIEVQGAIQVRERAGRCVTLFVLPPSFEALATRLQQRNSESPEAVRQRLAIASRELDYLPFYDYQLVNDDLDVAVAKVQAIIAAERCRVLSVN
ncbi:MAG: guanylate kinase [Candidatus Sericytochromatia bacterium]|nr:guanylate kinase [Candidatus Sericytochromatia bacterium]